MRWHGELEQVRRVGAELIDPAREGLQMTRRRAGQTDAEMIADRLEELVLTLGTIEHLLRQLLKPRD